jgi:hypothetical protein
MRSVSHFTPGPGGVMTDEVGVVTGELTLETMLAGDSTNGFRDAAAPAERRAAGAHPAPIAALIRGQFEPGPPGQVLSSGRMVHHRR